VLLRQAVAASPDDVQSRRYLAETLWQCGQFDEAVAQMDAAAQGADADSTVAARAAEMHLATGSADLALLRAEQAIRLDPQNPRAWALRGRAYAKTNQTERALADLHRALSLSPQDRDVLLEAALLYRQTGRPEQCLATLHRLLDTYPPRSEPQQVLILEGETLSDAGRHRQAADALFAASQRGPANAEILIALSKAQAAAGDAAAAAETARQALATDPAHPGTRKLVEELMAGGIWPQAVRR
jgi:tetratricopeptide (TPR) repeat protein